ncbi:MULTISPECIES: cysteine desulfurase NifS [Jonquetella]|uniref:Cysteine desulfurase n=1 Tax=Jonquetella anthropi DSM 22815 TaxID=885272 RepID=H0UJ24_9BACT|nr:cysteine desulfurase NifS [Jonquetella anthropi]EHM13851.1 cysteine desulfurase NifS [Jonquetella anthropi DSM 22815]ERL23766.1 cysteine desulfurase NifS [Jonquetella sp. BV3C21]
MRKVYMDNAATTAVRREVLDVMLPFFSEEYFNPSSLYDFSDKAREGVKKARQQVASVIGAQPDEVFFTGGGSEGDNWAIKGTAWSKGASRPKLVTSPIEHHAVLHTMDFLRRNGFEIVTVPVDGEGVVTPEALEKAVDDKTCLVSIMFANNEIGTIEPIAQLAKVAHAKGALFHTDAVQAMTQTPINVKELDVDMLSAAGHKFQGPKGVGFIYIRKGLKIENLIHGGGQEKSRRGGTENVPGIVGMGMAIELAAKEMTKKNATLSAMRDRLIDGLLAAVPHSRVNGSRKNRLPNNCNLSFVGIEGETMLFDLDDAGIAVSTGSACASASLDPSHVLMAIGLKHEWAHGSVRLTLGAHTTDEDIDYVLDVLPKIVARRREMSPLWHEFLAAEGGK